MHHGSDLSVLNIYSDIFVLFEAVKHYVITSLKIKNDVREARWSPLTGKAGKSDECQQWLPNKNIIIFKKVKDFQINTAILQIHKLLLCKLLYFLNNFPQFLILSISDF